jgi:beta-glucosidase
MTSNREDSTRCVPAWLADLTLDEKLSLVAGTGFDTVGIGRLGIPRLTMTDGPIGIRDVGATVFPASVLLSATFDPVLIERVGSALAREAKAHRKNVLLAPCVNLVRTPFGGRNFESFGEDPYLAARAAVAYIRGVQAEGVIATVKHYAVNNQETQRTTVSVAIDERTLHELYLPAFEASVQEAGVRAVMGSYNRLNGTYACEHPELLCEILRERWGFRGLVMSDWGATHSGAPALAAGLDLEMPKAEHFTPEHLRHALDGATINQVTVDQAVTRQLELVASLADGGGALDTPEHRALNREAARSGIVLLKNDGRLLPLDSKRLGRLAVVGPRAAHVAGGGGSAHVKPTRTVSLLEALREALGSTVRIDYAPGRVPREELEVVPAEALSPPPGEAGGLGLLGEYFPGAEPVGTAAVRRVDATVDFRWWREGPGGLSADGFSALWCGQLTAPATGRYVLALGAAGGTRLYLDGELRIDNWGDFPASLRSIEVELRAGEPHELRIEYRETICEAGVSLRWKRIDRDLLAEVRAVAAGADAVLVYVGDTRDDETEGRDRLSLELPDEQAALVRIAAAANPRTIVIVGAGAQILMGEWLPEVSSVLYAWFTGQEGGYALVDLIFGEVSPSGKLPITLPKRWEDCSAYGRYPGRDGVVPYDEGIWVGYRWFDAREIVPEFPFGHGLSYTTFAYRELTVTEPTPDGRVEVRLVVENTGQRPSSEVVELYVRDVAARVPRPEQELKAFVKVELAPGEAREVEIELGRRAFSYYDPERHDWVLEPGEFELRVGSSSRDIRLMTVVTLGQ